MEHLRFVINIFAFGSGFIAISLISLVYLKTYQRLLKYFLLWLTVLGLFVLQKAIIYYAGTTVIIELWYSRLLLILFSFSVVSLFIYFFLYLLFLIFESTTLKIKYNLYLSLSAVPVLLSVVIIILPLSTHKTFALAEISLIAIEIFLSLVYIFVIYKLKKSLKLISDIITRRLVNVGFIIFSVFIPIFIILNLYKLSNINESTVIEYIYFPLFFITFSIISAIFSIKFLLEENNEVVEISVSEEFMKDFNITERERDIILLIMDGLSNDEIASRLAITPGTVKVYNNKIFQKTEVKNRTSLVKLITEYNLNRLCCPWPG